MESWLRRYYLELSNFFPQIALGVILLGSLYQTLCHTEAFADDAAISFSYSRHLAATGEFIHTASSERVEGFSNPSWTLLCTLPFLLNMDPYIFSRALGVLCLIGTFLLLYRTACVLCPRSAAARFAAPLLFSMTPSVCFWTMAGLETPLIGLLIAAFIYQAIREEVSASEEGSTVRPLSGLIIAILAVSRPEGAMYAGPLIVYKLVRYLKTSGDKRPELLKHHITNFLAMALPIAAFLLWRRLYFAAWLPNTYYAKLTTQQLLPLTGPTEPRGQRYVLGFFRLNHLWALVYASPIAFLLRRLWPEVIFLFLCALTHVGFVFAVDGDWMGDFRFFAFAMPIYSLLFAVSIQGAVDLLHRIGIWLKKPNGGKWVGSIVALGLFVAFLFTSLFPTLTEYDRAGWVSMKLVRQQGVGFETIARRTGLLKASAAVPDVGGSALFTNLEIIDTVGLTDPVIARYKNRPGRMREYFFEEARPDFIQAHSHWRRYFNLPHHFEFEQDYVELPQHLTKRLVLLGDNSMRREHVATSIFEAEHHRTVELGNGLTLRGYDTPQLVRKQLVMQLYVESDGTHPPSRSHLDVDFRQRSSSNRISGSIDLPSLPPDLFVPGALLRLRVTASRKRVEAFRVRSLQESDDPEWIRVNSVRAGHHRGADLERFMLYPRSHFACAIPSQKVQYPPYSFGRIQRLDDCYPLHRTEERRQLELLLQKRAAAALEIGLVRPAIALLNRAELLIPESENVRAYQRHAARIAYRQAQRAADRNDLDEAHRLAVAALQADPLLSRARALDLELTERGRQATPDRRERAITALRRIRQNSLTPENLTEMLEAMLAANRPLDGARALAELELPPEIAAPTALSRGRIFLELGLCERTLEALGNVQSNESCEHRHLRFRAARICGELHGDEPSCDEHPLQLEDPHIIFDFERNSLSQWETTGPLRMPEKLPRYYISGYCGAEALRTGWVPQGNDGSYRATSPEFEIDQEGLSLQVGGGSREDGVEVILTVGGREIHRASGQQDPHLRRHTWNVSDSIGQRARIIVVDQGRGEWGHIVVDHIRSHPLFYFDWTREPTTH